VCVWVGDNRTEKQSSVDFNWTACYLIEMGKKEY